MYLCGSCDMEISLIFYEFISRWLINFGNYTVPAQKLQQDVSQYDVCSVHLRILVYLLGYYGNIEGIL